MYVFGLSSGGGVVYCVSPFSLSLSTFTIIIVTHNMQQALRVSDYTAFFNAEAKEDFVSSKVGYLVEFDKTKKIFNSPKQKVTQDYVLGKFG